MSSLKYMATAVVSLYRISRSTFSYENKAASLAAASYRSGDNTEFPRTNASPFPLRACPPSRASATERKLSNHSELRQPRAAISYSELSRSEEKRAHFSNFPEHAVQLRSARGGCSEVYLSSYPGIPLFQLQNSLFRATTLLPSLSVSSFSKITHRQTYACDTRF